MVRTVGQAPDWASSLDRPAYLQFLAALQRWLAVNGPGMVRGPELRLVHPRRSIELRPVVDAVRDAPDLYDALVVALADAIASAPPTPDTTPSDSTRALGARDTTSAAEGASEPAASTPRSDDYAAIAPSLSVRLCGVDAVGDRLALDVGVPGVRAVLVDARDTEVRDVTVLEASAWAVTHEELLEAAIARLERDRPDSVRTVSLAGIGDVVAIEGESVITAAYALWVERIAGHSARGWVVGIPDDHLVFVRSLTEPTTPHQIGALAALVREEFDRGLGPVSPELFWFGPDRVEVLVADSVTGTVDVPAVTTAH